MGQRPWVLSYYLTKLANKGYLSLARTLGQMAFCTTALGVTVYSLRQRKEIESSLFTGPF